jgi:hypothetical protein
LVVSEHGVDALLAFPTSSATTNTDSSSGSSHELAVWVPMQLTFPYRQFTTQYSCSGLEMRMTSLLLKLGARPDLEVRGYGCTRLTGPDPFAGVKIKMNVLEPAGPRPGLAAHWKRVDLLADRELLEAAADCELIEQIAQKILPLFSVRNVDYHATCQAQSLLPGAVRLKADVLVADQGPVRGAGQSPPSASPAR